MSSPLGESLFNTIWASRLALICAFSDSLKIIKQQKELIEVKRKGFLYGQICEVENVKQAIINASKGKRKRTYVKKILNNIDFYAEQLSRELATKTYQLSPNRYKHIFDETSQKERDITIPQFYPDQVIQWAVMQVVSPYFVRTMYSHSFSAVKGRGIEGARKYVKKIVFNHPEDKYVLKLDLQKFFPSISIPKMKELLARKFKDKDLLELFSAILDNGGKGLPIGYYTSQWLSTFYLEELDRFIKQELQIPEYARYVDDLVLIDTDKNKLQCARRQIIDFLEQNNYDVKLNPKWQVYPLSARPINFVGYRFYPSNVVLRKRTVVRIKNTTYKIAKRGLNIRRARRLVSLVSWARHSNFRRHYVFQIKPITSHKTLHRYIGSYYRRHRKSGKNFLWRRTNSALR